MVGNITLTQIVLLFWRHVTSLNIKKNTETNCWLKNNIIVFKTVPVHL